jgi:hypothetical protein
VKPVSKSRLARYGIDLFLHEISATVKPQARLLDGGAGNCKYPHFFPQARTTAMDLAPQRKRRYGDLDVAGNLYMMPFKTDVFDAVVNVEVRLFAHQPRPGGRWSHPRLGEHAERLFSFYSACATSSKLGRHHRSGYFGIGAVA